MSWYVYCSPCCLSPIRMPNSWRECQGLAWSDPLRERRSNNSASTSSSGTGKKTNSSPSPHLPFPLLSSPFFFYSLPLFVSSSSFLLLPFSLLPSSLFSPSLLPSSFIYLSYYSHSSGFPGSQPVSMDVQNIRLLHEKPYRVSWKADGTR